MYYDFKKRIDFRKKRPDRKNSEIRGENIRLITIGGFEEVGNNLYALEYKDNIWIFDMGFQFVSEDEFPGVSFTLPNIKYLEERKHKIKGVIITHGHLDHIGGMPYLMKRLDYPLVYTRELTSYLIKKRMEETRQVNSVKMKIVEPGDQLMIGDFSFEFFNVTHSIPNSMGVIVKTHYGNLIFTGDLKLSHENGQPLPYEVKNWGRISEMENLLMIADSTNCEQEGWSIQERDIEKNIERIIRNAPGRVVIATFASQFERVFSFIRIAEQLGKKVILEGRSILTNLEIAQEAKYFEPKPGTIIPAKDVDKYPADRILVISTGGQGEEFAALPRMARKEHPYIKLNSRDTVILSSSVIPGNEIAVRGLLDDLARNNCSVITYKHEEVHSTGHANAEELAWIIRQVHPKYFVPGYGFHSMLKAHKRIAVEKAGIKEENVIVPENGNIIEIRSKDDVRILKEKTPNLPLVVDGKSISILPKAVLDDRKALAHDGFINLIVLINVSKRKIQKSPDILSRGFIYLKNNAEILNKIREIIIEETEKAIKNSEKTNGRINVDKLKEEMSSKVSRYISRKTGKRPIIMPVILVV